MTDTIDRPTSPRLPAAERRSQLLRVALEMFALKGFHDTSMNEVAEAAGVTKPVLYQHFDSKRALYAELVTDLGNDLEAIILAAVEQAGGPRQQVEAGFRAYVGWATSQAAAFRVLFAERNRTDEDLADAIGKVETMIADTVARFIQIEGLSDEERRVLAYGVVGLAESTSRRWIGMGLGPGDDPDAFADIVAQLAWSGLRGIRS